MIDYNDMRATLSDTADSIFQLDSNPSTWTAWLVYLLETLDQKSKDSNPIHQQIYNDMLATLIDRIRNRQRTGGW
ncbi:MAG: hypothetical protein ACM3PY_18110 [Omnitrophica WOR_2 bacterium]